MKALITGITGQIGSYLAEILLAEGWEVHGLRRRKAVDNLDNLHGILAHPDLTLHWGDLEDGARLAELLVDVKPDTVYNFAAQSQVRIAFDTPVNTGMITGVGATRLLQLTHRLCPGARFYQASSSEMYGKTPAPQNEISPMVPVSPYGSAKHYAYENVRIYRWSYGMFASNGIMFNADSPRRGTQFVTRKIAKGVAEIAAGKRTELTLGNLDAMRDWQYARDAAEGVYKLMTHTEPLDLCFGSGETHSVREFVEAAFAVIGKPWQDFVRFDERLARPTEVTVLQADPRLAQETLDWHAKTSFKDLVTLMVEAELAKV